jgi:hypothetical protein
LHLAKVIAALEKAYLVDSFSVLFVVQDPIDSVLGIIESSDIQNKITLEIDGANYSTSAQAINGNLAKGLKYAFGKLSADLVVVLEDDIVISRDALCFYRQATQMYSGDKKFRGVNGFSREVTLPNYQNGYLRLNFGLAWGWAIPKRTYKRIIRFWNGTEDNHWDFILEPYMRTGFVVNPYRSRILNIGFDESATHTSGDGGLGSDIQKSFEVSVKSHTCNLTEIPNTYNWGSGVVNITKSSKFSSRLVYSLRTLLFVIYVLDRKPKKIYHGIRRRILKHAKYLS